MTNDVVPAGWYPDPQVAGQLRYWDGASWTAQRQPASASPPPPPSTVDKSNAGLALGLSIAGLMACQVICPVGMMMGRNELQRIDSGEGDPGARGLAQAAWIVGLIGTILLAIGIVIIILVIIAIAASGT